MYKLRTHSFFFFFQMSIPFLPSTKSSIFKMLPTLVKSLPLVTTTVTHNTPLTSTVIQKTSQPSKSNSGSKQTRKPKKIDLYVCGSLRVWNAGAGRFSPQNKGLRGNSGQLVFFDNNLVELLAVYDGLQEIYKTCGPNSKLTVYSSLDIASRVNGHSVSKPRYGPLLQRIKEQLKQFSGATITHAGSKHEHRKKAHKEARIGSNYISPLNIGNCQILKIYNNKCVCGLKNHEAGKSSDGKCICSFGNLKTANMSGHK